MDPIIDFFIAPYSNVSFDEILLEIIAVLFGVASVWYAKKENIKVYPTGIISTAIYVYICYKYVLYGDLLINIYYTLMSIYGWYMWAKTTQGQQIEIARSTLNDWIKAFGIFFGTAIFVVLVYLYFNRFDRLTDYFDTFTTGIFFAAMWLMANKKIEHWLLWILGNIVSIPLYFIKGLGFSGLQFTVFLVLAILGYKEWKVYLNKKHQTV